jgi:hypothetical protein
MHDALKFDNGVTLASSSFDKTVDIFPWILFLASGVGASNSSLTSSMFLACRTWAPQDGWYSSDHEPIQRLRLQEAARFDVCKWALIELAGWTNSIVH